MAESTRRGFLRQGGLGLAMAGAAELMLRADAKATAPVHDAEDQGVLIQMGPTASDVAAPAVFPAIVPIGEGPWYRPGAPFRGKLSQLGEAGTPFLLTGRVWALDTRRPLPGVVLDIWHVDTSERYSDGVTDFRNRGRVVTGETGDYVVESIRPIPYRPDLANASFWRCAHFHLKAMRPGYKPLVTEIHFKDEVRRTGSGYREENAVATETRTVNGVRFETAVFDIVLDRDPGAR